MASGCGTVGPPIAPEDVGVAPLIERQNKQRTQQAGRSGAPLDNERIEEPQSTHPVGQDEELPPLRPIGGR
jgi:hypothetical protein